MTICSQYRLLSAISLTALLASLLGAEPLVTRAGDEPPAKKTSEASSGGAEKRVDGEHNSQDGDVDREADGQDKPQQAATNSLPIEKSWTRVAKDYPIWIDVTKKEVIVRGRIALQRGPLEMFACPKGTKEHESVVAVDAPSRFVHLALLAVGARPGKPVTFEPEYRPASGTKIEIEIVWRDQSGKVHRTRAQEWVKNAKTGKPLQYDWVFGGSSFWTDEMTGERYYAADGGELVCVSNFSNATLDLPIESTAANQGLLFVANDEKIPPRGTPVLMVLRPHLPIEKPAKSGAGAEAAQRKKSRDTKQSGEEKKKGNDKI